MKRICNLSLLSALLIVLGAGAPGCDRESSGRTPAPRAKVFSHKRVLVLGCDGMDPRLVRKLIDENRMPNFAKLEQQGGFKPLETSIPPQSPVAWSNFITGANPGVHGVYDFIHRDLAPADPNLNVAPRTSTSIDVPPPEPLFEFQVSKYQFNSSHLNPFAASQTTTLTRYGVPFWNYLDERGIPIQIYKIPANYPPSESQHGHMCCLAGMGVPDALATLGTYQHFSTEPRAAVDLGGGRRDRIVKDFKTGTYIATIIGPPNEFLPPSSRTGLPPKLEVELRIYRDPENPSLKIAWTNEGVAGNEAREIVLNEGDWSDWQEIHFLKTPVGPSLPTMVRFYVQQVHPEIKLYVSPLNFIPTNCAAVISEPPKFVKEIGEAIGPFYTQGFAETFRARHFKDLDDEEYRKQADIVLNESMRMLDYALERYVDGVLFFYFSSTDLQSHIFWWDSTHPHPFRTEAGAKKYHAVVEHVYERMDEALGKCMASLGDEAAYIVMSDHGFGNFRRQFGLNSWLRENGYLDSDGKPDLFFGKTDWSKTRAYGLGINSLYLNLKGRERMGSVEPADRDALLDEITARLLAYEDPSDPDTHPVARVYRRDEFYKGPEANNAPDLIIGYNREYRSSWQTGMGGFDRTVVSDNREAWSADHCIAHDFVPGIVLSNRRIMSDAPALIDVAPTILAEFGIPTPASMQGRNMFAPASP